MTPLDQQNPPAPARQGADPRTGTRGASRKPARPCAADGVHADYLGRLGERVRDARARRGMTRRSLSRDSGVSERYLADLESGRGNVSIVLLRQIAKAMNMPLDELVREGGDPPPELILLLEYLRRLRPSQLAVAHSLLSEKFGAARGHNGCIALIGLRGAGKTTVGRLAADRLELPLVELAREVEAESGMRVDEIFSLSGQAAYRRYERRALERAIERHARAIIVTGGGSVADPATYEMLVTSCFTVWLKAEPEEHMSRVIAQGDRRPMAGNPEAMEDLRRILKNREGLYAQASVIIDTSGLTPQQTAAELIERLAEAGLCRSRVTK